MNVAIIVTELKEVKKESIVYYYEANELDINKETSGLLEFDLKLFDIDQDLEDVNKVIYEKILTNEMKIIRKCMNYITLADDVDIVGVIALRDILSNHQLYKKIPSQTFYMSSELCNELLTNKKTLELMKKVTPKTQKDEERKERLQMDAKSITEEIKAIAKEVRLYESVKERSIEINDKIEQIKKGKNEKEVEKCMNKSVNII